MQKRILSNKQIQRIHCALARRDLWQYCKIKAPDFYKDDLLYLKEICDALQAFEDDDNELLIINIAPRHGKTRTACLAVQWYLGRNNNLKVIAASYNEKLSRKFSKTVRNDISERKVDERRIVFSDVFQGVKIEKGSAAVDLWKLENSNTENYLATSPSAMTTGIGANIIIIDDLVKNAYEANHQGILEDHFLWFTDTLYSRLEGKRKIVLIMTRWATKDLAGRLIDLYQSQDRNIKVVSKKAFNGKTMLNERVLSKCQYDLLIQTVGEEIVRANYDQEPIDLKGKLYEYQLTYNKLPQFVGILSKCDSADTGADYLCNIIYGKTRDNKAYILDIYYTRDSMEITEKEMAHRLTEFNVSICSIESNAGGRSFSRAVERECRNLGNRTTIFKPYTQTLNKDARILSNATSVMKNIYFPEQWKKIFPEAYRVLTEYQRKGRNKNDDLPDTLTAIAETLITKSIMYA